MLFNNHPQPLLFRVRRLDAALALTLEVNVRRRRAATLQGALRIFMHGGEPKDHGIFARNDSLVGFLSSLFSPALPALVRNPG